MCRSFGEFGSQTRTMSLFRERRDELDRAFLDLLKLGAVDSFAPCELEGLRLGGDRVDAVLSCRVRREELADDAVFASAACGLQFFKERLTYILPLPALSFNF